MFKMCLINYIKRTGLSDSGIYLHHFLVFLTTGPCVCLFTKPITNHIASF